QDNSLINHMIVKTDFDGNLIQHKEFQAPGCVNGQMVMLPDGGFMIAMNSYNTGIHLMRVDATWNIVWTKRYQMEGSQRVYALILDGDLLVAPGSAASGPLYHDIILWRSDLSGNIGACSATPETGITNTPRPSSMSNFWTTTTDWNLVSSSPNYYPASVSI